MNIEQRQPRSITLLCSSLGYSRQAHYKAQLNHYKQCYQQELLLQQIAQIRCLQKRMGGRKLHWLLKDFMRLHHIEMGRDAFFNFLNEHGLLVRKRKRSKPVTTNSYHRFKKYKNLIRDFIPTAPNQLWVSDITYITLKEDFAYLSLITDAYSRKIVGFYLSATLDAEGSTQALKMALQGNKHLQNLIHHSDRGVQYCSNKYVTLLEQNSIKISMTENGNPLENAIAERVNGILKDELLEGRYENYLQAKEAAAIAISIYNHHRPHSSISYKMPFKVHTDEQQVARKWKNYSAIKKQKEVPMNTS